MFEKTKYPDLLNSLSGEIVFDISLPVFVKIAYRENSDGIVALAKPKQHGLGDLILSTTLSLYSLNRWRKRVT
jgi:TrmH family RNA methyltransferase